MSNKNIYEITILDSLEIVREKIGLMKAKSKTILLISIVFGLLGFLIAFLSPTKYVSRITFLVEDTKSNAGGLSSLAGQFGIDLGGSSGGGFLSGDNILLYFNSELLIREVLFSKINTNDSLFFVDRYAEVNGLKRKWKKSFGDISFSDFNLLTLPRVEDSLVQIIVNDFILKKDLSIGKLDKKSSFIELKITMKDEKLSKYFSEKILAIAAEKYVDSKIKIKALNVEILQRRADSLSNLLNKKTSSSAMVQQSMVDINPAIKTAPVQVEISNREKSTVAAIYSEVIKNLELSKTILSQVTPVVQIIDKSSLPLKIDRPSKIKYFITFFVFGLLVVSISVIIFSTNKKL